MKEKNGKVYFESRTQILRENCIDNACIIYFRIPFTAYFIGRDIYYDLVKSKDQQTKLYFYRKEWDGSGYYYSKI